VTATSKKIAISTIPKKKNKKNLILHNSIRTLPQLGLRNGNVWLNKTLQFNIYRMPTRRTASFA